MSWVMLVAILDCIFLYVVITAHINMKKRMKYAERVLGKPDEYMESIYKKYVRDTILYGTAVFILSVSILK